MIGVISSLPSPKVVIQWSPQTPGSQNKHKIGNSWRHHSYQIRTVIQGQSPLAIQTNKHKIQPCYSYRYLLAELLETEPLFRLFEPPNYNFSHFHFFFQSLITGKETKPTMGKNPNQTHFQHYFDSANKGNKQIKAQLELLIEEQ